MQTNFYATDETHISTANFDDSKFIKLVELPSEGGASAVLRKNFFNRYSSVCCIRNSV